MDQIFSQGRTHDLVFYLVLSLLKKTCFFFMTCFGTSCCLYSSAVLSVLLWSRLPAAQPGLPLRSCRLTGRHQARPGSGAQNKGVLQIGCIPFRMLLAGPRLTVSLPARWCIWPARRSTTTPLTEPNPGGRSTPWRRSPRWAGASTEWACHPR